MVERASRKASNGGGVIYAPPSSLELIPSGCTLLDLVLTGREGAWPLGRVFNIVGDKSTGKTLLAIEGMANFERLHPKGSMWYRESEHAFEKEYAEDIGMPVNKIEFIDHKKHDFRTVEHFHDDLLECCKKAKAKNKPGLYILDSLDALSDNAELEREIGDKSMGGMKKAAKMSELFRRLTAELEGSKISLGIISQVRVNIDAKFGRKTKRSGGAALDFYASQTVYLAHIGQIKRTRKGVERVTGIVIKAKCDKNKVGPAHRECEFQINFGYGIEDMIANLNWLIDIKRTVEVGLSKAQAEELILDAGAMRLAEYEEHQKKIIPIVRRVWGEIELDFKPARQKYTNSED